MTANGEPGPGAGGRAVVLGGGGAPGLAWMIGYLHGAREAGIDLADATFTVGTSAGSVAATLLLTPHALEGAFARLTDPARLPFEAEPPHGSQGFPRALPDLLPLANDAAAYAQAFLELSATVPCDARTVEARRRTMRERTGATDWPEEDLRITVPSRERAGRRLLDREAEADLITALFASCAVPGVWPAARLGDGDECIDAGVLSATHADLATEAERVVILRPIPNLQGDLPQEVEVLDRALVLTPIRLVDEPSSGADPRTTSALVGYEQAGLDAERLRSYWTHEPPSSQKEIP